MARSGRATAPPTSARATSTACSPNWPISYEDLAPFYEKADRLIGVSGLAGDLAMPPRATPTAPLHPRRGPPRRSLRQARLALVAGGSRRHLGKLRRPPGLQRLRHLQRLPARLDEQVFPVGLAEGAGGGHELRPYARALRIEKGRRPRLRRPLSRPQHRPRGIPGAEVVIVAANGVGTPRLLLASDNLANSSDQVGRNLLHHTLVVPNSGWTSRSRATWATSPR